jgi:RimJ/RimL family protein N-acetyltransferase
MPKNKASIRLMQKANMTLLKEDILKVEGYPDTPIIVYQILKKDWLANQQA